MATYLLGVELRYMQKSHSQTHWLLVFVATVAGFGAAFNVGKLAPTLHSLQSDLDLSLMQISWVVSSFSVIAMLFAFPAALVSSRYGAYRVALIALTLLGVGAFGSSSSDTFSTLIFFRVIEGIGFVLTAVSAPALISHVTHPSNRPVAMAIWSTWIPIGVSIMLVVSPLVLNENLLGNKGWRAVWLLTSVFAFAWLVVTAVSFFSHHKQHQVNRTVTPLDLTGIFNRSTLMLAASFSCYSAVFLVAVSMMPTVWLQTKGIPAETSSWWLSIIVAGCVVGNIIGGWLVTKGIPTSKILAASFVIPTCLGGLAFLEFIPFWLQLLSMGVFILFAGIVPGTVFAVIPTYAKSPEQVSLIVGVVFQGAAMGQVLGPILFGFIIDLFNENWNWGFGFYVAIAILGGIIMINLKPRNEEISLREKS